MGQCCASSIPFLGLSPSKDNEGYSPMASQEGYTARLSQDGLKPILAQSTQGAQIVQIQPPKEGCSPMAKMGSSPEAKASWQRCNPRRACRSSLPEGYSLTAKMQATQGVQIQQQGACDAAQLSEQITILYWLTILAPD